jgi:hypothetical protein
MIYQGMCTSFKVNLLKGMFNFGTGTTQTFKIALYTSAANLSAATTAYSATNESSGAGYTAGGQALSVSVVPTSAGTTAFLSFSDVTWNATTLTARGALIYKADGLTNPAIAVLDFGEDKQTNAGDFVINFPLADAANAIIQIA